MEVVHPALKNCLLSASLSTTNVSLRISRVQIISLVAFPTAAVGPSRSWTPRPAAVVHFVVPIPCFHMFPYASIFLGFCVRSGWIGVWPTPPPQVDPIDWRRLDLVIYGATPLGGALCCDATLVCPLTRAGQWQP